jgi:SAM-dependent methyltransferase
VRILSVACGHGTEADIIAKRMLKLGRSANEVKNAIWLIDKYSPFTGQAIAKGYKNVIHADFLTWDFKNMNFDVVVGNPPYKGRAALHQQFFNKGFSLLSDKGQIVFIQPATMYFNKKSNRRKAPELKMLEIVKLYGVSIDIKDESVFDVAQLGAKLAITIANKMEGSGLLKVTYMDGSVTTAPIDDINQLQLPGYLYHSIRDKFAALCARNGSIQDVVWSSHPNKAYIAKIRGHSRGNIDFYTIVPRKDYREKNFTCDAHEFGIPLQDPAHIDNAYDYCETNFARMALALLKFIINSYTGELALIPLMDFARTYTDQELYEMAGFTQEEIDTIEAVLPDYHNRKK